MKKAVSSASLDSSKVLKAHKLQENDIRGGQTGRGHSQNSRQWAILDHKAKDL